MANSELKQILERAETELAAIEARLAEPDHQDRASQQRLEDERRARDELRARVVALREQVARDVPPIAGTLPSDSVGQWSPLPLFEKPEAGHEGGLPPAPFDVDDVEVPDREAIARAVADELRSEQGGAKRLIALARRWKHDRPLMRLLIAALRTMRLDFTADQFSKLHQLHRAQVTACETRLGPTPWLSMAAELPDEFDGLTATQRLLLEVMREAAPPGRPFLRLSEIAAEVAVRAGCEVLVERTLISLGHPSLRRVPLVEFQGFTGRFTPPDTHLTHARLAREAIEVLDETFPLPLLLVNGAEGIGGCVPPHRPTELAAACLYLLESSRAGLWELKGLEGPDFPDGGVLLHGGVQGLWQHGESTLVRRSRLRAEVGDQSSRARIVIEQVPWPRSSKVLKEELVALRIDGVTDVVDQSSAEGVRLVVELEHVAFTGPVLEAINKSRVCECSFRTELLVHGNPTGRRIDLLDLLKAFLEHRREVAVKKLDRALAQAKLRAQTAEAVCVALALIDPVQAVMRAADDDAQAITGLMRFLRPEHRPALATLPFHASHPYAEGFTEHQARHLVSVRRLAARRPESAQQDWAALLSQCDVAAALLNDRQAIMDVVRQELRAALTRFDEPRRTRLVSW